MGFSWPLESGYVSLPKFGDFLAIIALNTLHVSFSVSSPSAISIANIGGFYCVLQDP